MGASQSSPSGQDLKIFPSETALSFNPDVVNRLSDQLEATVKRPADPRQSVLDAHIRAKIQDELEHLKKDEEAIRQEIERALGRENLDRERAMAGEASSSSADGTSAGDVKISAALLGDIEEVKSKIEKHQANRKSGAYPEIDANTAAVAECYRRNKDTPLNCWSEVRRFTSSVEQLEQQHFKSHPI